MNLKTKKRIAKSIFDVGNRRIWIDPDKSKEVKEAITRNDIKGLVNKGIIVVKQERNNSRYRTRKAKIQEGKGRRKGIGSRKGARNARLSRKLEWMIKIRNQKQLLKGLRDNKSIPTKIYRDLYRKSKGGFFRSKRHIQIYLSEHKLIENGNK